MDFLMLTDGIDGYEKPVACFVAGDGSYIPVAAVLSEHLICLGAQKVVTDYVADLGAAANRDLILTVGDTEGIHLGLSYSAGADAIVRIFRDTTHDLGAALGEFNRNQNKADGCGNLAINVSGAGGADGTQIFVAFIPGGSKDNSSPGGGRSGVFGWMLEANTKYLVRLTNISAAATPVSIQADWHRHHGG